MSSISPITEHKRKDAVAASNELTQALVDHLNVGYVSGLSNWRLMIIFASFQDIAMFSFSLHVCSVAQAYLNQKRLDAEAKQLHTSATNFAKQTQQWMNLIEGFSNALKVQQSLILTQQENKKNMFFFIVFRKLVTLRIGRRASKTIWLQ